MMVNKKSFRKLFKVTFKKESNRFYTELYLIFILKNN